MRTLYFDCGMGAAGDMLTAALLELMPDPEKMLDKLNSLGIPGVKYISEPSVKCGITGTHVAVIINGEEESPEITDHCHEHESGHVHEHSHDYNDQREHGYEHHHSDDNHACEHHHSHHEHDVEHHHSHSGMADIEHVVKDHMDLPESVKKDILSVFGLIAEAESHVHGVPVEEIHFHEVGTMDAVADITAVCLMIHELLPDQIVASPVHVGSGQVKCAHGILPVPAPAAAYILKNIPIYGGKIDGELCTPTGAALLKYFVTEFGDMPVMRTGSIGYGMGKKDFPAANCIRAMLGETSDRTDTVIELSCNIDDMTAETIGYASQKLLEGGALDVITISVGMKKGRPGTMLQVLCRPEDKELIAGLIFMHTSTLGIRESVSDRFVLDRMTVVEETSLGPVQKKISYGYGVRKEKYEYDDIIRLAEERGCSIREILSILGE